MEEMTDFLIVGAGLTGSVIARILTDNGYSCRVIDKREHIGGNIYQEEKEGIKLHKYGAHIFRTDDREVWDFVNRYTEFNRFTNSPIANYKGELYNLPFNMNTFHQLWGVNTPEEAKRKIEETRVRNDNPQNLEEHVLNMCGKDIYQKLVKEYTEKQWGRDCRELPKEIIRRIPLRYRFDNNYYDTLYQGVGDYNKLIFNLLEGSDVALGMPYERGMKAGKIIYTGALDELYGYENGVLEYRGLYFETKEGKDQGVAVMNYTSHNEEYTRSIDHKHFEFKDGKTFISYEYPIKWESGKDRFYPVNDEKNNGRYKEYRKKAEKEGIIACGQLGDYHYYDMAETVRSAIDLANSLISR